MIESDADVAEMIELLRLNYDRAVARHGLSDDSPEAGRGAGDPAGD